MSRSLSIGLTLAFLVAGGLLLWWGTRSAERAPPSRQSIAGLTDTVSVRWTAQETATITAKTPRDALRALGYAHGLARSWVVAVWRRTALGRLSAQFGTSLVPLDRHVRRLGLAHHARQTYRQLPESDRRRLQAYTQGLNAALQAESVRRQDAFVFLGFTPQPWKPWHPLAVERLLAWMGTTPPGAEQASSVEAQRFWRADRLLRHWLHLHGWDRSVAWAVRSAADSTRTVLFARHALGVPANPQFQEVVIQLSGRSRRVMGSLPGTLLFPTGTTGGRAWTYLLSSPTRLEHVAIDSAQVQRWHERVSPTDGDEHLVPVWRHDQALILSPASASERGTPDPDSVRSQRSVRSPFSPPVPDSAWVLRWPGFRPGSDVSRWITEANLRASTVTERPAFSLLRGTGLAVDSTGAWTVQGRPPIVERTQNTVLVGRSPWARYQAHALQASPALAPDRWSRSDSSAWAATLLPKYLPDLAPLAGTDSTIDAALPYLRNWNYAYESSSIGAVVFERWMRAYRTAHGDLPPATDRPYFAAVRSRRAFRRAIRQLVAQHGPDVRRWRWERVASQTRSFLVWSADSLVATDLRPLSTTQFASLSRPGQGHASTLGGGPTLVDTGPLRHTPAQWEGWIRAGRVDLTVRRLRFDPTPFLARSLHLSDPSPVSVTDAPVGPRTQLVPAPVSH